jgi:hypothetical protein
MRVFEHCEACPTPCLPLLVVERKSLGGAWGKALNWSIIDLAWEHS